MEVLREALKRVEARERVALVTVVETAGSTPRKPGARMLVGREGLLAGTVGGGRFEMELVRQAQAVLERGGFLKDRVHLTQQLAQCCGGEMEFTIEVLVPPERLFLFGAGHVSKELAPLAKRIGFHVSVLDEREDWLTRERFPGADALVDACDPADWKGRGIVPDADTYCVIVTHDHPLDQRILQRLMECETAYTGLIGSRTKVRKFLQRLTAWGIPREKLERVHAPIGLAIGASTPAEIAVSIAAELIAERAKRARKWETGSEILASPLALSLSKGERGVRGPTGSPRAVI